MVSFSTDRRDSATMSDRVRRRKNVWRIGHGMRYTPIRPWGGDCRKGLSPMRCPGWRQSIVKGIKGFGTVGINVLSYNVVTYKPVKSWCFSGLCIPCTVYRAVHLQAYGSWQNNGGRRWIWWHGYIMSPLILTCSGVQVDMFGYSIIYGGTGISYRLLY